MTPIERDDLMPPPLPPARNEAALLRVLRRVVAEQPLHPADRAALTDLAAQVEAWRADAEADDARFAWLLSAADEWTVRLDALIPSGGDTPVVWLRLGEEETRPDFEGPSVRAVIDAARAATEEVRE